jgi:hypothetical protein
LLANQIKTGRREVAQSKRKVAGTMKNAEARRRTLQGYEVDARIDWLKDHIRRLKRKKTLLQSSRRGEKNSLRNFG